LLQIGQKAVFCGVIPLFFAKNRLFWRYFLIFLRFRPFVANFRDNLSVLGLVGFLFLYFAFLCKFCAIFRKFFIFFFGIIFDWDDL